MDYTLIDTHAHLTMDRLYVRIDEVIESAKEVGFDKVVVICTNLEEFYRARDYQKKEPMIDIALGFHPGDVQDVKESDLVELERALKDHEVIAVGEIGLDYHYEGYVEADQKKLFIDQIELANKYGYPILIHMRDATKDTLDIIKEHCKTKFLMHCFSGSKETATIVIKMGGYISFAGPITFKNARGLLEVPAVVPTDRIFVESDAPFLTPHPFRGKENESKYVAYTFEKVAELLDVDKKALADQMQLNFKEFFKL
ncbi:TatD family hydrolase [Breznakia pachnodae]|uniref:TatD DNase family protein n=1 Tax=Breznakia pachnodae TaxID=265178 RepID=A0ABU0E358_9FIRM|nr:TatD family hydrolase [Breznakia pachnodae]MDQ0361321.1 TatD DNase family protein [Breznakia pachnodae]